MRALGEALCLLAGARLDLLDREPGARARFVALAGVLLSTGALAVLSAAFALHMAVDAPWPVAVGIGLFWGVVIVNLDRMLIVGLRHDASVGRNLALALPRVVLALILGVVIATPMTLQVFHSEIDTQVVALQEEKAAANKTQLNNDPAFRQLPGLQLKVATEKAVIASGGTTDPALQAVHDDEAAKRATYQQEWDKYLAMEAKAQQEFDGTGGTGVAGDGPQYREDERAAQDQKQKADAAKAALDSAVAAVRAAEATSVAQAQANVRHDQGQVDQLSTAMQHAQATYDARNARNTGLLIRLEALSRLGHDDATLQWAHWMLEALFVSIELLPVLMKTLLNLGKPTAYDQLLELEEQALVEAAEIDRTTRRQLAEAEADSNLAIGRDRIERQQRTALTVNGDVVEQQQRIITRALKVWGEHTERVAADQLADYEQDLHTSRATAPAPPFVTGTPAWSTVGAPGQRAGSDAAPWSNPPRTPSAAAGARSSASTGNFTVDPDGTATAARRLATPFLTSAEVPSVDDI